jgi:hypothetical protein
MKARDCCLKLRVKTGNRELSILKTRINPNQRMGRDPKAIKITVKIIRKLHLTKI